MTLVPPSLSLAKRDALYVAYLKLYDPPKFESNIQIEKEYNEYCKYRFFSYLGLFQSVIFALGATLLHFHPWNSNIHLISVYSVLSKIILCISTISLIGIIYTTFKAYNYHKNYKKLDDKDKIIIDRGAFLIFESLNQETQKIYEGTVINLSLHQTLRA